MSMYRILDEDYYRKKAGLAAHENAAEHYLSTGWREGLNPNPHFESEFLAPFYESVNPGMSPAEAWLELEALGGSPPINSVEANAKASLVRASSLFDAEFYARSLPHGLDPALHYVIVGERLGWRPSLSFDPGYYFERYNDVAQAGVMALLHFESSGRSEGRRPLALAETLAFPPAHPGSKKSVLLITHDASRSGAPILAWNIARQLGERYSVITLVLHGGDLERSFEEVSDVCVGPLTWDDWHVVEIRRIAERLVDDYRPIYAIANSVISHQVVPPLASLGVATVALVHEFAGYIRPVWRMRDIYDWATHVIFPAHVVADSSYRVYCDVRTRHGLHFMSQGCPDLPTTRKTNAEAPSQSLSPSILAQLRPDEFLVLGAGSVEIRKGLDLFIAGAAVARRTRPEAKFRFLWIGAGYDPVNDTNYSVYLAEQIAQSGLDDIFTIAPPVEDLEPFYRRANVFFMSSRLDPQPNVGIDAVTRGIPTICFEGACGTAEVLSQDPVARRLVVAHLDAHAAGVEICNLWEQEDRLEELRSAITRLGRDHYDMRRYIEKIDTLGRDAAAAANPRDVQILVEQNAIDPAMVLTPGSPVPIQGELERISVLRWHLWQTREGSTQHPYFRRPCAGFHPQAYAAAHPEDCVNQRRYPLAHWLERGRSKGPWSRDVFTPLSFERDGASTSLKVALHCHFHYPELAGDFRRRLDLNETKVDVVLTTDETGKASRLRQAFSGYRGKCEIRVTPNRGRDIGPFLTSLSADLLSGQYDIWGHLHAKRSLSTDKDMGEAWRNFLWDNLIGEEHQMLDLAAKAFDTHPRLGLLFADDPHLVSWNANRPIAEGLARRMGIEDGLPDYFDFPLGTMFWIRPDAIRPLTDLNLQLEEFPPEPIPYDGSILHAIERLIPIVVGHAGYEAGGLRAPYTTW
jgi:glycosyltransferase involved in cell wall biosynthesis